MSTSTHALTSWSEFQHLPERAHSGHRFELHDGVVVTAAHRSPSHIKLQKRIEKLLESLPRDWGVVTIEFPYRPQPNLQFWFADVALSSGTEEFWIVDPDARTITVTNSTGTTEYSGTAIIPIATLGASLPLNSIFT